MRTAPSPTAHVVASVHDDGIVLLQTKSGRVFTSNRAGARIWQHLERRMPVDAIAADLSDQYRISYDAARNDVALFLIELERHGLAAEGRLR